MPSAKRKHPSSESSSDSNDEGPSTLRALDDVNPSKRQRLSTLEFGFAHLNIQHNTPLSSEHHTSTPDDFLIELDTTLGTRSASPMPVDSEPSAITLPSSIEEPDSPSSSEPQSADVKMRTQSWYEPEKDRIIITDLDDSSDDDADSDSVHGAQGIHISSALLQRIKEQPNFAAVPPARDASHGALVLFRPILPLQNLTTAKTIPATLPPKTYDDAMDVEL